MNFSDMFSSSTTTSYGRFCSFLVLACLLIWTSLLLKASGKIPDIPTNWFYLVCVPYGLSKGFDVAGAVFGNKDKQPDPNLGG